jgi:hypothetical protein
MFINNRVEPAFPAISSHRKPINVDLQAAIAEFEEKIGVTDLDALDAPKRKTPRTDAQLRAVAGIEHKRAARKAQAEHKAALARLADGTAVHRQVKDSAVAISKPAQPKPVKAKIIKEKPVLTEAQKAQRLADKEATKKAYAIKRVAADKIRHKAKMIAKRLAATEPTRSEVAAARQAALLSELQISGRVIVLGETQRNECTSYQMQHYDVKALRKKQELDIVRVKRFKDGVSCYMINNFAKSSIEQISGRLDRADRSVLEAELASGKFITLDKMRTKPSQAIGVMRHLADKFGTDIHTVFRGRFVAGWIVLAEDGSTL